jgi:1,4-dihydroxy-2-naphthoate octaprenyltransferase
MAMICLATYYNQQHQLKKFFLLTTFLLPVLVYFLVWAAKVWKKASAANFNNTMRMNVIASIGTNLAFVTILAWRFFE